ncbi:hypothetical protein V1477_004480 [Vespula maculifrons]|uniref:Uncharacterized protein n=1 Tax=Vespula maculifrons TaxID=7453 RepID=A0ABD2CRP5_VESMC
MKYIRTISQYAFNISSMFANSSKSNINKSIEALNVREDAESKGWNRQIINTLMYISLGSKVLRFSDFVQLDITGMWDRFTEKQYNLFETFSKLHELFRIVQTLQNIRLIIETTKIKRFNHKSEETIQLASNKTMRSSIVRYNMHWSHWCLDLEYPSLVELSSRARQPPTPRRNPVDHVLSSSPCCYSHPNEHIPEIPEIKSHQNVSNEFRSVQRERWLLHGKSIFLPHS